MSRLLAIIFTAAVIALCLLAVQRTIERGEGKPWIQGERG